MASPLFLCVLILCGYYSIAAAGDEHHSFVVVSTSSFEPEDVCSTSRVTPGSNRAAMPLVHRHGPCAPSQSTDEPSLAETLSRNRARANYIISRASRGMSTQDDGKVSIPTYQSDSVESLEYVATVSLGTPAVPQVVLIDTGNDLSWVQCCKPSNSGWCYPQKDPLFDPSKSSTYAPIPCYSDACKNLTAAYSDCTNRTLCEFRDLYVDVASTTSGVYSKETLTLAPGVTVKNFHFGCGNDQGGPFGKYDGILGLGTAPESLVVQTSPVYGGAFSYCLPPVNSKAGFLALGAPSNNTSGFLFTPMGRVQNEATSYSYVVTLTGISVGGKQLNIPPSVFSGGMIIDSGVILTALPSTAYKALQSAFQAAMAAYPLLPNGELGTCYNLTSYRNVTVPRVALTFSGGTTINLNVPNGVLLDGCLVFRESGPDGSIGVIGNVNQRTFEVLYDAGRGKAGFRAGAC